jgi:hypothetical protein
VLELKELRIFIYQKLYEQSRWEMDYSRADIDAKARQQLL